MPMPRKHPNAAARQAAYRARRREEAQVAGPLAPLPGRPGPRRWKAMHIQALGLVEQLAEELEAYCEERTEAWQDSARGEAFGDAVEAAAQAAEALREVALP
jgi:hypothetical protein